MADSKITFEEAMQIGLDNIDPQHQDFARQMMIVGAKLVISAVNDSGCLGDLKLELSELCR